MSRLISDENKVFFNSNWLFLHENSKRKYWKPCKTSSSSSLSSSRRFPLTSGSSSSRCKHTTWSLRGRRSRSTPTDTDSGKKQQRLKHGEETGGGGGEGGGRLALWAHLCCLHCWLCRWSLHRNQELNATIECWYSGSLERWWRLWIWKSALHDLFSHNSFSEWSLLFKNTQLLTETQNQSPASFISSSRRSWGCLLFVFPEGNYSRTLILW